MIQFTQGDTAVLNLTATDGDGDPVDLTGAVFTTYIRKQDGTIADFPNSQHTIVSAPLGTFQLAMTTSDTAECGLGENKDIITKIVQGSSTITYRAQGILTVNPPVPVQ